MGQREAEDIWEQGEGKRLRAECADDQDQEDRRRFDTRERATSDGVPNSARTRVVQNWVSGPWGGVEAEEVLFVCLRSKNPESARGYRWGVRFSAVR